MKQNLTKVAADIAMPRHGAEASQPHFDKVADKVATAVMATVVVQSGRGVFGALAKNPWIMFGLGVASGCVCYKYRREIKALSNRAAEQGKDFVQRQKYGLKRLLNARETASESEPTE